MLCLPCKMDVSPTVLWPSVELQNCIKNDNKNPLPILNLNAWRISVCALNDCFRDNMAGFTSLVQKVFPRKNSINSLILIWTKKSVFLGHLCTKL